MRKFSKALKVTLGILLAISLLAGCSAKNDTLISTDEDFAYSYGIDDDGFWNDIKALKNLDLCDYTGITIPKTVHEISDDAVQAEIDSLLIDFMVDSQVTDRAIVDGDTINLDYVGSVDSVPFDGGSTGGNGTDVTIGVTSYIDDFLEQLIGHTPGESFDIEVTFPSDYSNEELSGKDAVFAITLNYIIESEEPELTDAFVAEKLSANYDWNTVTGMKDYIRTSIQDSAIDYYIQEYIAANTTINTLPDIIIEYQEFTMIQYYMGYANYYSLEYEEFLSTYLNVTTTDELIELNLDGNTKTSEMFLIMQAIAEDAGITVTEDDTKVYFTENQNAEDFSEYENVYGMPHLKMITIQQQVLSHIKENITLD